MQAAGLSVAAQIMQRRQSISPPEVPDAAEVTSDDDEPEGNDELAELSGWSLCGTVGAAG